MIKNTVGLGLSFLLTCALTLVYAQQSTLQLQPAPPPSPRAVPAAMGIGVLLNDTVTTQSAVVGQPVKMTVMTDLYQGTQKIVQRGDKIWGHVSRVEPPIQGRNAMLGIATDRMEGSQGSLALPGWVDTGNPSRVWGGQVTEGTSPVVVPYKIYDVGTYGRVMYHGPRKMGEHIKLLRGTRMVVVLQDPLQ